MAGRQSILDIIIKFSKQGDADKDTVKALVNVKSGITEAMGVMAALAGVGFTLNQVYTQTVGVFESYAAQVRENARLTGASTEETSRLIQVSNQLNISQETLQKSLWFAAKHGVDVSTESLAKLADKYVSFNSATERATFLGKEFGKGGADMGKLLELGGEGVKKLAAAIGQDLILTEAQVKKARELEIAQEALNESWNAAKISVGSLLAGPLTGLLNSMVDQQRAYELLQVQGVNFITATRAQTDAAFGQARAERENTERIKEHINAIQGDTSVEDANTAAKKANAAVDQLISGANTNLLGLTMNLQQEMGGYNQKLEETTRKYGANSKAVKDLEKTHGDAMKKIAFDLLVAKLEADGFSNAEFEIALKAGVAAGLYDQSTAVMAKGWMKLPASIGFVGQAMAGVSDSTKRVGQSAEAATEPLSNLTGNALTMGNQFRNAGSQVNAVISHLKNLDGSVAHATIIITTIRVGGGGGGGFGAPGLAQEHPTVGNYGLAAGGTLFSDVAEVGEEGREGIIKRDDGRYVVVPNAAWMEMKRLGLVPGARGLAAGAGELHFEHGSFAMSAVTGLSRPGAVSMTQLRQRAHDESTQSSSGGGQSVAVDVPTLVQSLASPTQAAAQAATAVAAAAQFQTAQAQKQTVATQSGNQNIVDAINALRSEMPRTIGAAIKLTLGG